MLLQRFQATTFAGGHLQNRIIQLTIYIQQAVDRRFVLRVQQVGLVQQQQRFDAGVLGGHKIAVDQVAVGFGQWRENDDDQIDVRRHCLELAAAVRPAEFAVAWQLRDDHAAALIVRAPDNAVAGDQGRQVGATMAAEYLSGEFAVQRLDLKLHTKVRDHQAVLLFSQITTLQFGVHPRLALGCAGGALFLDLLDAPALASGEVAFGHGDSATVKWRRV